MAAPRINCVFDMDETLGQFNELYGLMAFLSTQVLTQEQFDGIIHDFANDIKDGFDIGLLRPGLYKYFAFLYELQQKEILHSTAIYSNNSWQPTVSFLLSIINAWFPGLMCDGLTKKGVHSLGSNPEFRKANMIQIQAYPPKYDYKKQWGIIEKIFQNPSCGVVVPTPEYTFFYDDNLHDRSYKVPSNLKETLGNNYIRNSAYSNGLNPEFWGKLRASFQKHGVTNADDMFHESIQTFFKGLTNENLFTNQEKSKFINGTPSVAPFSFHAFVAMVTTLLPGKQFVRYTPYGTHGNMDDAINEYNNLWIPPILEKLTDEEKAGLSYPIRANVAGGRRRRAYGKTRKQKKHYKKRTYKKYSRK